MKCSTEVLCVAGALEQRMKNEEEGRAVRKEAAREIVTMRGRGLKHLVAVIQLNRAMTLIEDAAIG